MSLKINTPHKHWGLLPKRNIRVGLDKLTLSNGVAAAVSEWLPKLPDVRGWYITGPAATGKTTLAVALANAWNEYHHHTRYLGYTNASEDDKLNYYSSDIASGEILFFDRVMPVDWYALTSAYKTIPEYRRPPQHELVYNCDNPNGKLLWLIDDFAGGHMSDHIQDCTERFLRGLYNEDAVVIITSNVPPNKTAALWNDQIRSRLIEMCAVITLKGTDRRVR